MRNKNKNILLLSAATIVCAASLIIGSSYAIFTDTANVHHHLEAGNLKVGLDRTKLVTNTIGENGALERKEDNTPVNLLEDPEKVFKMTVVPGAYVEATIELSNLGDVAFDYTLRTTWTPDESARVFAEQVKITINGDFIYTLDTCNEESNFIISETPLYTNAEPVVFTIKAEFENLDEDGSINNAAQGKTLDFDLLVEAKQHI